jgi:hypothetical protein
MLMEHVLSYHHPQQVSYLSLTYSVCESGEILQFEFYGRNQYDLKCVTECIEGTMESDYNILEMLLVVGKQQLRGDVNFTPIWDFKHGYKMCSKSVFITNFNRMYQRKSKRCYFQFFD